VTDACRIDVWLWRARFFKTRSLAARVVEEGGVRLLRGQSRTPLDKPSRAVRCGDVLTFAQGPRWVAVKVEALGERRGPAPEARALYSALPDAGGGATGADVAAETPGRAVEGGDFNHTHG
jgi:ribosome-associated heat shock protein Hsp15